MKKVITTVLIMLFISTMAIYLYSIKIKNNTKEEYEDVRNSWVSFINKVNHKNDSLQISIEENDSLIYYFNKAKQFRRLDKYDVNFEYNEYNINNNLLSIGIKEISSNQLLEVYNQKAIKYNYGLSNIIKIIILRDTKYREPFGYFRIKYGKYDNKNPIELQKKLDYWIETGDGNPFE